LLIGHHGHEEVEGTAGEAPDKVRIVDGLEGARTIVPTPGKNLIWLSQTTLSVDETMETVAILKERFPDIQAPPSDDICYATQNRQEAIKVIAPQADLVIVVGSQNSSNSVRLAEVALEYGAKASHLIDYAEEIQDHWFTDVETIGVTSGASVPEILVKDVLAVLAENGFRDVQEITAAEESLLFALPPELRKDMKAAGIA
jgi:4-hydroxy-3-methylbut-2-enyl diphosphate reductase